MFFRKQVNEYLVFTFMLSLASSIALTPVVRTVWEKPRTSDWWDNIVLSSFATNDWFSNFRMSQNTYVFLCDKLRPTIAKRDTIMRKAVTVEKRVAIALWFLATGADYRTIGHLFGVSKSTVCLAIKNVCSSITSLLLPQYIKFPQGKAVDDMVYGFKQKFGFPQCAGIIDGSHIPIVSPQVCPADYYNRKGWHSVILQGTVDHNGLFIDINVGWPGRVHDARVFSNSTLYSRGVSKVLLPNSTARICGKDIPLVLLGDPAYPLLPWVMKAYPNTGHLTQQQKCFNYNLSKTRVTIEHSYGRLKGRWRCLLKRLDVDINDVPTIVTTCCVLHNMCELSGDLFMEDWLLEEDDQEPTSFPITVQAENSAVEIRDALTLYFSQQ